MPEPTTSAVATTPAAKREPAARESAFGSENLKQGASQAMHEAGEQLRGAGEQIRQSAQSTADEVRQQGLGFAQDRKAKAASQLGSFGAAIRSAADRLHEENDHNLAAYAEATADKVENAAQYLNERDFSRIADDVEGFARRQPELFLGGMFLAGLGIARFLKASRPHHSPSAQSAPGYRLPEQYTGV